MRDPTRKEEKRIRFRQVRRVERERARVHEITRVIEHHDHHYQSAQEIHGIDSRPGARRVRGARRIQDRAHRIERCGESVHRGSPERTVRAGVRHQHIAHRPSLLSDSPRVPVSPPQYYFPHEFACSFFKASMNRIARLILLTTPFVLAPRLGAQTKPVDWNALAREAQSILADYLRVNTTNPPGNELLAA